MTIYICDDGNAPLEIMADSPSEAAEEYVTGGDWGNHAETIWINVQVREKGTDNETRIKIPVDPDEPDCDDLDGHDWQSPHEVVGGLESNPGVFSSGGGAKKITVCAYCGMYRIWDGWATDPEDGEQGLESVSYRDADEKSLAWVESMEK